MKLSRAAVLDLAVNVAAIALAVAPG